MHHHTAQLVLGILGSLTIGVIAGASLVLRLLRHQHDERSRALPSGRMPVAPFFQQGRNALLEAEAAVRDAVPAPAVKAAEVRP
ncbi:MAG TPA: hypothetical protein VFT74_13445 [Isosphaeraceae bacterium]|nr:hypothetical protein [Isosphaeraceae bacterium]